MAIDGIREDIDRVVYLGGRTVEVRVDEVQALCDLADAARAVVQYLHAREQRDREVGDERLYGPPGAEDLDDDLSLAMERVWDAAYDTGHTKATVEEWTVHDPLDYVPHAEWIKDILDERSCEEAPFIDGAEPPDHPDIWAAIEHLRHTYAAHIHWRGAAQRVAVHTIRWDGPEATPYEAATIRKGSPIRGQIEGTGGPAVPPPLPYSADRGLHPRCVAPLDHGKACGLPAFGFILLADVSKRKPMCEFHWQEDDSGHAKERIR